MKKLNKARNVLTSKQVTKLIAEFIKQADKLDEQAFDAKTDQDAKRLKAYALWLRQKVSEIKGERIPTRTTTPPDTVDE